MVFGVGADRKRRQGRLVDTMLAKGADFFAKCGLESTRMHTRRFASQERTEQIEYII